MTDHNSRSNQVLEWFRGAVRPILQKTSSPQVLEELDKLAVQIEELERNRGKLFPICLVGQAGVGKSTLINTLIADTGIVVPSGGGAGPLTANALRVVYGERPSLVVQYHSKKQINETRFILEAEVLRQTKAEVRLAATGGDEESAIKAIELDSDEDRKTRTEEAIGRARLLVAGAQSAAREMVYLADALRIAMGQPTKSKTQILEEDMGRLRHVQEALQHGTRATACHYDSAENPNFGHSLRDHACGFLAPLIQEMTIHWPSPVLRDSLELVDLPGIGVLSDVYASVTSEYLRNRARAVMLVVDSRGIRRNDAELLKDSGFLNRLLHASNDLASDPVALIVVVVKIDDVAEENWRNDKQINNGIALKTKAKHFSDQVVRCREDIAKRLHDFLREVWDDDSEGKRLVIQSILDNLQVFPVSAPQYRLLHENDPDEGRPFLPDKESTNIPALRLAISKVARQCLAEQTQRYGETLDRFFGQLRARLEVLSAQISDGEQTEAEIKSFKESLDAFLFPLKLEFGERRAGFRTFLRKTIPTQIEDKVEIASAKAQKAIQGDLRKLRDIAHWRTLQAAVRREGTFYGSRHINLPHDFALRFEEPVAEVWSCEILVNVRKETREFAEYQSGAVTKVLDWARGQGIRKSTRLLEALVEAVNQHRQQVNAVGKEAVNELRDKVRSELIRKIEGPIRRRCQKFVEDGWNSGRGIRDRILDLFAEMAEEVVTTAADPTTTMLVDRFREVDKEILAAFQDHSEPLTEAANALVQHREKSIQREDAQVASAVEAARASMPSTEKVVA